MKIYFARHGESNYNVLGLVNSKPNDGVFLTDLGKKQAKQLADNLRAEKIEAIFASELLRTKQTAEFVNTYHEVSITIDGRLNDIDIGTEGSSATEYNAALISSKDPFIFRMRNNAESAEDVQKRMRRFLEDLVKTDYGTVLVVSSEIPLLMILSYIDGDDPQEKLFAKIKNCQLICREVK